MGFVRMVLSGCEGLWVLGDGIALYQVICSFNSFGEICCLNLVEIYWLADLYSRLTIWQIFLFIETLL